MDWFTIANIGMQVFGALGKGAKDNAGAIGLSALYTRQAQERYNADLLQWTAQKAWQNYSNTMVRLSDSVNQNAITTNEILSQRAFADQALKIKQGSMVAQARTEVAAAAAGVKGRSVNQAMFDVQRNAANRERERQDGFVAANLAFDQQRLQSSMGAQMQQDYSYLPKPKSSTYYLDAAIQSAGAFAQHGSSDFLGDLMGIDSSILGGGGGGTGGILWNQPHTDTSWAAFLARN